ncbi:TRAP transporter small permease [candidate division KSB1 bacterium]|nr:TRAP transporter small permease [candidate division KSB1 bacterium]MBL7092502.1 TRAP transporter small permease [candidate division KSB1 bacterium]
MRFLKAINNFLAKIESAFLIILLTSMILIAFLQVILRNFFLTSILWGDIFLRHLVLWVGFLGAALATKESKHINIDALSRILSPTLKKITGFITNLFAAIVCFFLAKASFTFIGYEKESQSTLFADIPTWIFQTIIVFGFGIIMFRFLIHAIESLLAQKSSSQEEPTA